jgi:two-component system, NarL family, sensor kinase
MEPAEQSVRRAVLQFALTGLLAVALIGAVAVQVMRSSGRREAIAEAERASRLAGRAVVAPRVTDGLVAGRTSDIERLDGAVREHLLGNPFVRIKVWTADGRIVYADEPRLIGAGYPLSDESLDALRRQVGDAEISDLAGPENRFERRYGELLEVYQGVTGRGGEKVLVETYQPFRPVAASGRDLWLRFLPALVGALVLLELALVPLAYLLARRLRDRQRERSVLLQRAIDASEAERRRIAGELHDGPVQQLAAVAFGLGAAAGGLNGDARMRELVDDAATRTRETMRDLRGMLVDLYPATLHRSGLAAAVRDLLSRLGTEGVDTSCEIPDDLELPAPTEALIFRAAREALENARKHASASRVDVRVADRPETVVLTVEDDGRGFDTAARRRPGHLGLDLLHDLADEGGGSLRIDSAPGRGTVVMLEVPRR